MKKPLWELYKREVGAYFHAPTAYVAIAAFLLIAGYLFATPLFLVNQATLSGFLDTAPLLLMFFVPAVTMRLFAEEFKAGTAELLFSLPLEDGEIIGAKLAAAMTVFTLTLAFTLVYPAVLMLLGNLDPGATFCAYAGLWLSGLLLCAAGLFASSLGKSQVTAFITGFMISFVFYMAGKASLFLPSFMARAADFAGMESHLDSMARGVLDLRDMFYFVSFGGYFVFLTALRLKAKRSEFSTSGRSALSYSAAGALLVAAIIAVLNVFASFAHAQIDMSRGRIFSITPATKKILAALPARAVVTLYCSRELPPQMTTLRSYVRDLLREYESSSSGKVAVELVSLGDSQNDRDTALKNGIEPVQFDSYARGRVEQREGYFGITLQLRDKKDSLPYLDTAGALEYELTSHIKTLALDQKPVLGFVTTRSTISPYTLPMEITRALDEHYKIEQVDLSALDPAQGVPPEIRTLVTLGDSGHFSDAELFMLDRYLASGGNLLAAVDTKHINPNQFTASPADDAFANFLSAHGVTVKPDLIIDAQSQSIQLSRYQGGKLLSNVVKYPFFIMATGLNRSNPATKGLPAVVMPFCSPVEPSTAAVGGTVDVLLASSRLSELADKNKGEINIDPFASRDLDEDGPRGPFLMGIVLNKKFAPLYPAPKGIKAATPAQSASAGRLGVLGTAAFIEPSYGMPDANNLFFLNVVDWMAQDQDLISIRGKDVNFMPLAELPDGGKAIVRHALILLPPLAAALLGLFMWNRRIAAARKAAKTYGGA
jgi:ABC-2 type transport system permease protein